MGDPKRFKKRYSTPSHPWQKDRIVEEDGLSGEYGTKNKKEIWKLKSLLSRFADQAKKLTVAKGEQAEKEKRNLMEKLFRLGLITEKVSLEDVLGIDLNAIMERRLQTLLLRKDLARTMKQARQFITHGHVTVNGKIVTSPNYLVSKEEEGKIGFVQVSSLADPEHPERTRKPKPEEIEVMARKRDAEKKKEDSKLEEKRDEKEKLQSHGKMVAKTPKKALEGKENTAEEDKDKSQTEGAGTPAAK